MRPGKPKPVVFVLSLVLALVCLVAAMYLETVSHSTSVVTHSLRATGAIGIFIGIVVLLVSRRKARSD